MKLFNYLAKGLILLLKDAAKDDTCLDELIPSDKVTARWVLILLIALSMFINGFLLYRCIEISLKYYECVQESHVAGNSPGTK